MTPRQTNVATLLAFDERMRANAGKPDAEMKWQFSWSVRSKPQEVTSGYLQAAYLLMFAYFGYDFIFRDQYEPLRQQILNPRESIWTGRVAHISSPQLVRDLGNREWGVILVREPVPCVAAVLKYRPSSGVAKLVAVVLPSPEAHDDPQPKVELGQLHGSLVSYRPEMLTADAHYYFWLWRQTRNVKGA